tara:strand:- start:714 stop:1007 length:294 start_codon:yes stop_codon:yes gene_type:complete
MNKMIDADKNKEQVAEGKLITITGVVSELYFEELMDGRESFHDVEWDIQEYDEDAPPLLEEVKRLRRQLAKANKFVHNLCQHSQSMMMDYEDYMKED